MSRLKKRNAIQIIVATSKCAFNDSTAPDYKLSYCEFIEFCIRLPIRNIAQKQWTKILFSLIKLIAESQVMRIHRIEMITSCLNNRKIHMNQCVLDTVWLTSYVFRFVDVAPATLFIGNAMKNLFIFRCKHHLRLTNEAVIDNLERKDSRCLMCRAWTKLAHILYDTTGHNNLVETSDLDLRHTLISRIQAHNLHNITFLCSPSFSVGAHQSDSGACVRK